jgi:hypothetical protein
MDTWPLSATDRQKYLAWAIQNNVPQGGGYNMPAFWKAAQLDPSFVSTPDPNDGNRIHYPDDYKYPDHPSFSQQSRYYDPATMPQTPEWVGGGLLGGGEAWSLTRPDGEVVKYDAPWFKYGSSKGLLGE